MRGRLPFPVVALILLLMVQVGGWAQLETVPKQPDEELYGSWVNAKALAYVLYGQKSVVGPDAMEIYGQASDPAPDMVVSWDISSKWTDSEATSGTRPSGRGRREPTRV